MEIKKNISLWVGLAIPIVMIILVALAIYVPKLTAPKPQINFLYVTGTYALNMPGYTYRVDQGKLVKVEPVTPVSPSDLPTKPVPPSATNAQQKIFVYDVKQHESREVSFDEAKNFNLDTNQKSADGFEVSGGGYDSPFGGGDYNTRYLKGHGTSERLNINSPTGYYDFIFMGWIKE